MQAGRLNRKITIQKLTETKNTAGEITKTWANYATTWAEVRQTGSREMRGMANATIASNITFFRIRYFNGITAKMRIKYEDEYYNILGPPKEYGRREGLEITAETQDHGYNT
jgi:SPP1 family predicted phage head-tail adaptor